MLRKFCKILVFFVLLVSCSYDELEIKELNSIYLLDESGACSFLLYYEYSDKKDFSSSIKLSTEDDKYTWSADCRNLVKGDRKYQIAGRFLIPDSALDGKKLKVRIDYRDTGKDDEFILKIPKNSITPEIYSGQLVQHADNKQKSRIFQLHSSTPSAESAYVSCYSQSALQPLAVVVNKKNTTVNVVDRTKEVVVVQRGNETDQAVVYTRTMNI